MAGIPKHYLDQLRTAGLLISEPSDPDHITSPDGVTVGKPATTPGHSLPEFEVHWDDEVMLDAPMLQLHFDGDTWSVISDDDVLGLGPGDFVNEWHTPEEAIADILDFYFGSPARMDIKRLAHLESLQPFKSQHDDEAYMQILSDEIGPERCQQPGCKSLRIRYSVLCKRHHFEMITGRACPE